MEPVCNWMGFQKYYQLEDSSYAYEFKYENEVTFNTNISSFMNSEKYKKFSQVNADEYFTNLETFKHVPSLLSENYTGTVWLAKNHQLDFECIFALLETLIFILPDSLTSNILSFLTSQKPLIHLCSKKYTPDPYFPVKFLIPMVLSLSLQLTLKPLDIS